MNSIAPYFQRIQAAVLGLVLIMISLTAGGCRICADCEDLDYPAYGGAWQRTLRQSGRVGSVFDPGGAKVATLVDKTAPENPDQIERSRQDSIAGEEDPNTEPDDDGENENGEDENNDPKSESMKERERKLREKELDDVESDAESELREKTLDDIEVRIIPGRAPLMINTN